jgi:putative transposon-encoded protein
VVPPDFSTWVEFLHGFSLFILLLFYCYNITIEGIVFIDCCHIITIMKPFTVTIDAYDTIEKEVSNGGSSGRVFVPKTWAGKKVRVILLEPLEEE